jgi:hypothetical protein
MGGIARCAGVRSSGPALKFMTEFFLAYTSESTFRELLMLTIGTALVTDRV